MRLIRIVIKGILYLIGEIKYKLKLSFIKRRITVSKVNFAFITTKDLKRWFSSITLPDKQLASYANKKRSNHIQTYSEIAMDFFGNIKPFYDEPPKTDNNYPLGCHLNQEILDFLDSIIVKTKLGIEVGSFIGSSSVFLGN